MLHVAAPTVTAAVPSIPSSDAVIVVDPSTASVSTTPAVTVATVSTVDDQLASAVTSRTEPSS